MESESVRLGGSSTTTWAPATPPLRSRPGGIMTAGRTMRAVARALRRRRHASRRWREAASPGRPEAGKRRKREAGDAGAPAPSPNQSRSASSHNSPRRQPMEKIAFADRSTCPPASGPPPRQLGVVWRVGRRRGLDPNRLPRRRVCGGPARRPSVRRSAAARRPGDRTARRAPRSGSCPACRAASPPSARRAAKNVSNPAGAGTPRSLTGASVPFQCVWTTPLGTWTNDPAGASTVDSPRRNVSVPSST